MIAIGDILVIDHLIDNHNIEIEHPHCIVTDITQGIIELMPYSLFLDIYHNQYNEDNNQLYYLVDNPERYHKIGRIDRKIIKELFNKMNLLKGTHVFEYVMPK